MSDDFKLLHRYATEGSEAAFGELVQRYANLVYDGNGAHATMTRPLQSGTAVIRVRIRNGLIAETITREK